MTLRNSWKVSLPMEEFFNAIFSKLLPINWIKTCAHTDLDVLGSCLFFYHDKSSSITSFLKHEFTH